MAEGAAGQARLRMAGAAIYITTGLWQDGRGVARWLWANNGWYRFMQRIGGAAGSTPKLD